MERGDGAMNLHGREIKLFAANSNPELAKDVSTYLGIPLGRADVGKFSDGETSVSVYDTVRGCDVFVIQSISEPTNDNLMELLVMVDAFKRARGTDHRGGPVLRIRPSGQKSKGKRPDHREAGRGYDLGRRSGQDPYDGPSRASDPGILQYPAGSPCGFYSAVPLYHEEI